MKDTRKFIYHIDINDTFVKKLKDGINHCNEYNNDCIKEYHSSALCDLEDTSGYKAFVIKYMRDTSHTINEMIDLLTNIRYNTKINGSSKLQLAFLVTGIFEDDSVEYFKSDFNYIGGYIHERLLYELDAHFYIDFEYAIR